MLQVITRGNDVFDAIVVGSGATGGWAAKELTEAGLKVCVLICRRRASGSARCFGLPRLRRGSCCVHSITSQNAWG